MKREDVQLLIISMSILGVVFARGAVVLLFAAYGEYGRAINLPSAVFSIHIKYFVLPMVWPALCAILASTTCFGLRFKLLRTFLAPVAIHPEKHAEPGQWPPAPIEQGEENSGVD